jgi:hypothetical protein
VTVAVVVVVGVLEAGPPGVVVVVVPVVVVTGVVAVVVVVVAGIVVVVVPRVVLVVGGVVLVVVVGVVLVVTVVAGRHLLLGAVGVTGRLAVAVVVVVPAVGVAPGERRGDRERHQQHRRHGAEPGPAQRGPAVDPPGGDPAEQQGAGPGHRHHLEDRGQHVGEGGGLGRGLPGHADGARHQPHDHHGAVEAHGDRQPQPGGRRLERQRPGQQQLRPTHDGEERTVGGGVVEVRGRVGEVDDGGARGGGGHDRPQHIGGRQLWLRRRRCGPVERPVSRHGLDPPPEVTTQ